VGKNKKYTFIWAFGGLEVYILILVWMLPNCPSKAWPSQIKGMSHVY
jgi:hypothetical protein